MPNATPNEDPPTDRLRRYFARYPGRDSRAARFLFRRGEDERLHLLQSWLPDWDGLTVLDAGCGDGVFLARLLAGRPRLVRLEDFVERWTTIAAARLKGHADTVEAVTTDVTSVQGDARYDIVVALGLLDYTPDRLNLLQCLIKRACGVIVVDFPRRGTLHSLVRRIWLRLRGVRLYPATREELMALFESADVTARIEGLPLQWVAYIDVKEETARQ